MITFEKIRDLERTERDAKGLQKLPDNFVADLQEYLHKKEKSPDLDSVTLSVSRLFEMRLRKITEASVYKASTNQNVSNTIQQEDQILTGFVEMLRNFHKTIFTPVETIVPVEKENEEMQIKPQEKIEEISEPKQIEEPKELVPTNLPSPILPKIIETPKNSTKLYRVVKDLPAFVGPDLKVYELKEGDIIDIPQPLIDLLLKEGVVVSESEPR